MAAELTNAQIDSVARRYYTSAMDPQDLRDLVREAVALATQQATQGAEPVGGAERWMAIVREKADDARKNAQGLRQFEGMETEARARELAAQYLLETAHVMVLDERHAEALANIVDQSERLARLRAAITAPPPTAEVEKLREEHQAHEEVRPSVATKPLWAKCPTCDACWPAAYLPMPLHAMARAASRAVCPNNCAAKPLVADQNDGVLLEPLRAFPLSTWNEDLSDVCWWHWTGREWAGEAAWIGRPIDSNWPGYHTHWTPHPNFPEAPKA